MLVLTRKSDQSIMIGDDVEVTVLSVSGEKVRLGIQAPASISVHRTEIYLEIQEGGRRSKDVGPESGRGTPGSRQSSGATPDESGT